MDSVIYMCLILIYISGRLITIELGTHIISEKVYVVPMIAILCDKLDSRIRDARLKRILKILQANCPCQGVIQVLFTHSLVTD